MLRALDGKTPKVHPTAFVSEFAYVIGDVEIGEGSSIWPGAVVRADMGKIKIGRYTSVQDNCVVHGDAEMVLSLESASGQSRIACQGALQERAVRDEICRVMEGGREAFESRYQRIMPPEALGP